MAGAQTADLQNDLKASSNQRCLIVSALQYPLFIVPWAFCENKEFENNESIAFNKIAVT